MLTSDFRYDLPAESIAQTAIEPRDASRLLRVADMSDHVFNQLPHLLEPGDLLVVNRTRVRHARLRGVRRNTGGTVELLLLRSNGNTWEALVRPARRIRPGVQIDVGPIEATVLTAPVDGRVDVTISATGPVEEAIAAVGEVPLPPYFHGRLPDAGRYQTVFAKVTGSAAAPTAALHFTPRLIDELRARGVAIAEVELEVGLDTFRPMAEGSLGSHTIHSESFTVPRQAAAAVAATRSNGGKVVAVGTTVVRTLESAWDGGALAVGSSSTALFIRPGFTPQVVDSLITNFHAPQTTLIVLVAALIGESWRTVYVSALERGYRFLSFGDAMLIEGLRSQ